MYTGSSVTSLVVLLFISSSRLARLTASETDVFSTDEGHSTSERVLRLPPVWVHPDGEALSGARIISDRLLASGPADDEADLASKTGRALSGSTGNSGSQKKSHPQDALLFLFNGLVVGTAVMHITTLKTFRKLQQTVVLFVLGLLYSLVQEGLGLKRHFGKAGISYDMWMDIDPHLLLFTLLPALLMGDAMTIDTSVAKRVAKQCIYLAGPGVLINALLVGGFLCLYFQWRLHLGLMTGAILCATDPVAVVALLKELGASPTLTVQIQGESLLNDGTAIVLFSVTYRMLQGEAFDVPKLIMTLVKMALMAIALGMFMGFVFYKWIRMASNKLEHDSSMIQISLTLCCAYWSYIMAEMFQISGVLATVASALVLANKMWPFIVSQETMHHVWHTIEFLGNTIIFFLAGALVGNAMVHIDGEDYFHLLVIYVVLLLARAGLIFLSRPVLRALHSDRQPVTVADAAVMTWGGLRGAVGLALAIQVRIERAVDGNGKHQISLKESQRVLFFVSGIAFLTTVINATTCPALVKYVGITALPHARMKLLRMLHKQLVAFAHKTNRPKVVQTLMQKLLSAAQNNILSGEQQSRSWTSVRSTADSGRPALPRRAVTSVAEAIKHMAGWADPKATPAYVIVEEFKAARSRFEAIPEEQLSRLGCLPAMTLKYVTMLEVIDDAVFDLEVAKVITEAFLALVRSRYWGQIKERSLDPGSKETTLLLTSIQIALSRPRCDLCDFQFITHRFSSSYFEQLDTLSSLMPEESRAMVDVGREEQVDSYSHRIVASTAFSVIMFGLVICNGVWVLVEEEIRADQDEGDPFWVIGEIFFTGAFAIEFLLKFVDLRLQYFMDGWNLFDFTLVIAGIIGIILELLSPAERNVSGGASEARLFRFAKVFRILRLLRLFRLFRIYQVIQAKFKNVQLSPAVAEHMTKISLLVAFVQAHTASQNELVKYLGECDKDLNMVEVARCILQSQTCVYKALVMAVQEELNLDPDMLLSVNSVRESKVVTEELEGFILGAMEGGLIGARDAESILDPLHDHIRKCMHLIRDTLDGFQMRLSKEMEWHELAVADECTDPSGPDSHLGQSDRQQQEPPGRVNLASDSG